MMIQLRLMFLITLVFCVVVMCNAHLSDIKSFRSDDNGARFAASTVRWSDVEHTQELKNAIILNPSKHYQKFDGVGGSFMRSGAYVLNKMPAKVQDDILRDLFHPTEGAGFLLGKVPIGATDFGIPQWYTYAENPQDSSLPDFSIAPDLDPDVGFIPFVQRAQKMAGRKLRLEATLDYPPAWMLDVNTPLPAADLNATYLPALANYYLKYAQALEHHGVPAEFLSLFNEVTDSYMNASYDNIRSLLVDHVSPLFRATKNAPKLTWTEKFGRRVTLESSPSFYEMTGVQEASDVIFYHGYDCNYGPAEDMGWQCDGLNTTCPFLVESAQKMREFYEAYGQNRTMWMTELCYASEFGDYQTSRGCASLPRSDFQDAMQWGAMIFADFNIIQASGWIYWNLILDTTGGPWLTSPEHNDPDPNEQQPVLIADPTTGKYHLTGAYYALAHFGKFVTPGSVRIDSLQQHMVTNRVSVTSFLDQHSQTIAVVLMNDDVNEANISLVLGHKVAAITLPAVSFTTLSFHI